MADIKKAYTIDPNNMGLLDSIRTVGGHVASGILDIPAIPTGLYGLANMGTEALGIGSLPGSAGAEEFTKSIQANSHALGSDIAGRELQPGLLNNNTTADKVGTAFSILTNLIPVTGGPIVKGLQALKNIDTGIKALNTSKNVALEAAKFLSPVVPTSHPKTLIAGSAAIGTGLTVASDLMAPDELDKPIDMEKFKAETNQIHDAIDLDASINADTAAQGVDQVIGAKNELDFNSSLDAPIDPARTSVIAAGLSDLGDYTAPAAMVFGIGAMALANKWVRGAARDKALQMVGGKELKPDTGAGILSRPEGSNLSVLDTLHAQTVNAATPLKRESMTPEIIQAKFENVAAAVGVHLGSLRNDGKFAGPSNIRLNTPLEETVRRRVELAKDAPASQLFTDTMNAETERSNRRNMWLDVVAPKSMKRLSVDNPTVTKAYERWLIDTKAIGKNTPEEIEKKFAFHTLDPDTNTVTSFKELGDTYRKGMSDPRIAQLVNDFKDVGRKALDYRLEQGRLTKREYNDLLREHPAYFPVDVAGRHMSATNLTPLGGRFIAGDPSKELFPHIAETVREVAHGKLVTAAIMEQRDLARQGNVRAKELLGKDVPISKINKYNEDKIVKYRNYNGVERAQEIRDPTYRLALHGDAGSVALRLTEGGVKAISMFARGLEWGTTGPGSAVFGSVFAPINAAYGTVSTLINRMPGTSAGMFDRGLQNAGFKGLRGDPTFVAQVAWQMGENVVAVLAKHSAAALENVVRHQSPHAGAVGPSTLDTMAKFASNHYKSTILHDMESRGLKGGATPMYSNDVQTMKSLEDSMSAVTKLSAGWRATREFVHDMLGAIGNAPQGAYFKQNRGYMPEGLLTTRTRNVMGDPSKSGLGTSLVGKSAIQGQIMSPWGGVTTQATARFLEAWRTNPTGTAIAIFNTVAIPSISATAWNASLGKEYSTYQHMGRTSDQVSGSIYIGIPGELPEKGLELKLDQLARPFKVMIDTLVGHTYGLYDGSIFGAGSEAMLAGLTDSVRHRYGPTGDAMSSAMSQLVPALNPLFNAGSIALGGDQMFRSYTDKPTKITENRYRGATGSTSSSIDNKWFGYDVSAKAEALMSVLGGQIGRGIYETLTGVSQGKKEGLTVGDTVSDYSDRFKMRLGQSSTMVSGLWGNSARISPSQEASAKTLQESVSGLRMLEAAYQTLNVGFGTGNVNAGAKQRGFTALLGVGPVQFKDDEIKHLARSAQFFLAQYSKEYAGPIKDLYQQRNSVLSSEKVTPEVKQRVMNDVSKDIIDVNRRALEAVQQWKWRSSKIYNRDIDLRNIDMDKGIDQFKSLLPQ